MLRGVPGFLCPARNQRYVKICRSSRDEIILQMEDDRR